MGSCFSSAGDREDDAAKKQTSLFAVTIAFPTCLPYTLTVNPDERIGSIRRRIIAEMERRSKEGENICAVEGKLVTVDGEADNIPLRDNMTVAEAMLQPKQYLWFQDKNEDTRMQDLLLRSSRLTENTSHNSRGVKQGMALIRDEDECDIGY